jgi:hypothetical protein
MATIWGTTVVKVLWVALWQIKRVVEKLSLFSRRGTTRPSLTLPSAPLSVFPDPGGAGFKALLPSGEGLG